MRCADKEEILRNSEDYKVCVCVCMGAHALVCVWVRTRLCVCVCVCVHQPCKLLNGVIPALVAMSNIAVRYHCFCDGHV